MSNNSLMGFASKIPKENCKIQEVIPRGLASDEAGLLNERDRLLLLMRKERNGGQRRSGDKPGHAGRRRRKSREGDCIIPEE